MAGSRSAWQVGGFPVADGRLWIGNRRYSSWSLRGWLAVRLAGLDVEDVVIPFARDSGAGTPGIKAVSPNGLVPYLRHRDAEAFESLAIIEYCAELAPGLWPGGRAERALARSWAAEMHAGFADLRRAMPMNLGRTCRTPPTAEVAAEIRRIEAIWGQGLAASGGPFLGGKAMGALDCMYAPVVARFLGHGAAIGPAGRAYCAAVRGHPLVARWYDEAASEPAAWLLAQYEDPA